MNDVQIFQLFGITLFTLGLSWVINHGAYKKLIKDIAKNEGVLFVIGLATLITGYLLIEVYQTNSILILVLGWSSLIKGIFIILLPVFGLNVYSVLNTLKHYFTFVSWLVLLIGAGFLYLGYFS